MKKQSLILWVLTLITIAALTACTAQPVVQPTEQATATPAIVATKAPTQAATLESTATAAPTATTAPTATLEPTATVAMEPTIAVDTAVSPTAAVVAKGNVVISMSQNTICRTGPATVYPSVTSIPAGVQVNAVGRLAANTSYTYVENPTTPGNYCWVFSEGAAVQGRVADLLVVEPLPSPTPESDMGFNLTYSNITTCGDDYSFAFFVKNTNKLVWQSIKVHISDTKTKRTADYQSNRFERNADCVLQSFDGDLALGESEYISPYDPGHFDYSPFGGTFLLRVTLCSEKDLGGTCMTKEIRVKP